MVRSLFKYNKEEDCIKTVSRGGKDYDAATTHLRDNERLLDVFRANPNLILDGELYVHGWPLQKISGTCRLKTWEERCEPIEYWIYDIVDMNESFHHRLEKLENLQELLEEEGCFKVIEHIPLTGWEEIHKYHNKFVAEGFEGLIARNPDKAYSPGKRNSDWIKVKEYQDDEFEITGIAEGLRDEDMCFTLKAPNGKEFKAKPVGNRELKLEYLENWPLFVGKMGTVTFFEYSEDGTPMQPVFKSVREKDE